jgi:hypothetical protein
MTDREEKIRQRAYSIWEAEGHPHGRADDHWHRAAREVAEPAEVAGPAEPAEPAAKTRSRRAPAPRKRATKA